MAADAKKEVNGVPSADREARMRSRFFVFLYM
jgi:hypothetical protein